MKKAFSILRLISLLTAAAVLIFSFSIIERLKILKGKEAQADAGGSTSGDGSSGSTSTTGNSSGGSSGGDT